MPPRSQRRDLGSAVRHVLTTSRATEEDEENAEIEQQETQQRQRQSRNTERVEPELDELAGTQRLGEQRPPSCEYVLPLN
jgi:hypothetical protein